MSLEIVKRPPCAETIRRMALISHACIVVLAELGEGVITDFSMGRIGSDEDPPSHFFAHVGCVDVSLHMKWRYAGGKEGATCKVDFTSTASGKLRASEEMKFIEAGRCLHLLRPELMPPAEDGGATAGLQQLEACLVG